MTKGDGVEAVNAYNLACDNGITAVFGATMTGTTIALADATYEDNMPQVTASRNRYRRHRHRPG